MIDNSAPTDAAAIARLNRAAIASPDPCERQAAESLATVQAPPRAGMAASGLMADPAYKAAFERTQDRNLSAIARDAAVREMEGVAMRHFPAEGRTAAAVPVDLPEGYEAGQLHEYQADPETYRQISDHAEYGATAQAAQAAGVPAGHFRQGLQEAASRAHLLNDDAGYEAAVRDAKATLGRMHGAEASAIARDGVAYLNALAAAQPALEDGVALMLTSPWAIAAAAQAHRAGLKPHRT